MIQPKVLVGCPVSDHKEYCLDRYAEVVMNLDYDNYDVLLVDNSKDDTFYHKVKSKGIPVVRVEYTEIARDRLVRSRNVLVDRMISGGYDYFFSLEVDVIPPKDIIQKLLSHGKSIVSGVYFKPLEYTAGGKVVKKEIVPLAYKFISDKSKFVKRMTFEEVKGNELIKVAMVGLGCVMIKKDVFERGIRFNYDEEKEIFDDNFFCKDAREKGYGIYLDTSMKCFHMVSGTNWNKIKK